MSGEADLLSRILAVADKTLDRPTGELRRLDEIERLFEEAERAHARPSESGRRVVNDWTLLLIRMLRKLEQLGPLGDADDLQRATAVGLALVPYITGDVLTAHQAQAQARPSTSDHDFIRKGSDRHG